MGPKELDVGSAHSCATASMLLPNREGVLQHENLTLAGLYMPSQVIAVDGYNAMSHWTQKVLIIGRSYDRYM